MSGKSQRFPKGGKAASASARRSGSSLRSAVPIVGGGVLLAILVGLVLLVSAGGRSSGSVGPAQVVGRPRLAIDRERIDFGKVPLGRPVQAVFTLTNAGDRPLRILNRPVVEVKQGC